MTTNDLNYTCKTIRTHLPERSVELSIITNRWIVAKKMQKNLTKLSLNCSGSHLEFRETRVFVMYSINYLSIHTSFDI